MRSGGPLKITGGRLVVLALTLLAALALVRWADPVRRLAVDHPVLLWCVAMASIVVSASILVSLVPLLLVDAVLARVGAGWDVGLGAVGIVGAVGWVIARRRTDDPPIRSPRRSSLTAALLGRGTVAGSDTPGEADRTGHAPAALIPIGTLVILPAMCGPTR